MNRYQRTLVDSGLDYLIDLENRESFARVLLRQLADPSAMDDMLSCMRSLIMLDPPDGQHALKEEARSLVYVMTFGFMFGYENAQEVDGESVPMQSTGFAKTVIELAMEVGFEFGREYQRLEGMVG